MKPILVMGLLAGLLVGAPAYAESIPIRVGSTDFEIDKMDTFTVRQITPDSVEFDAAQRGWDAIAKRLKAPPAALALDIVVSGMPYDKTKLSGGGIAFLNPDDTNDIHYVIVNSDGYMRVMHHAPNDDNDVESTMSTSALRPGRNHLDIRRIGPDSARIIVNQDATFAVPLRFTTVAGIMVSNTGQGSITVSNLTIDESTQGNAAASGPPRVAVVPPLTALEAGLGAAAGSIGQGLAHGGAPNNPPMTVPPPVMPGPLLGPLPGPAPVLTVPPQPGGGALDLVGTWQYQTVETLDSGGRLAEQVEITFTADGRYQQAYQFSAAALGHQVVQIEGHYRLDGDHLTLMPQAAQVLNGPNPNALCVLGTARCVPPDLKQTTTVLHQLDPNTIETPFGQARRVR